MEYSLLLDMSESTLPAKSSRRCCRTLWHIRPGISGKCLTVGLLYYNALEACQRHAATF